MLVGALFSIGTYFYIVHSAKDQCKHFNTCPFSLSCTIFHPEQTKESVSRASKLLLQQEEIDNEYKTALETFVRKTEELSLTSANNSKVTVDL